MGCCALKKTREDDIRRSPSPDSDPRETEETELVPVHREQTISSHVLELEEELKKVKNELQVISTEKDDLRAKLKQSEEDKLQSMKDWTEKNNTLTAANKEKEKEIDDLKKQYQETRDNMIQYQNVNTSLEGEVTTLKSKLTEQVTEHEVATKELETTVNNLKKEVDSLQNELATVTEKWKASDVTIDQLKATEAERRTEFDQEKVTLTSEIEKLRQEVANINGECNEKIKELEKVKDELKSTQNSKEELEERLLSLQQETVEITEINTEIQQEVVPDIDNILDAFPDIDDLMIVLSGIANDKNKWHRFGKRLEVPESTIRNCLQLQFLLDEIVNNDDYMVTWGTVLDALENPTVITGDGNSDMPEVVREHLHHTDVYLKYLNQ